MAIQKKQSEIGADMRIGTAIPIDRQGWPGSYWRENGILNAEPIPTYHTQLTKFYGTEKIKNLGKNLLLLTIVLTPIMTP